MMGLEFEKDQIITFGLFTIPPYTEEFCSFNPLCEIDYVEGDDDKFQL